MKKSLLIALLTIVSLAGYSQDRKDFFSFANAFNWSMSEAEFKAKYASRIVPENDSLFLALDIKKGTYLLNDLRVGDYDCITFVTFSSKETPSIVARPIDEVKRELMPSVLSSKLDRIVDQKMKEPDYSFDDMPLSEYGFSGVEGAKGMVRIWMTDALTFSTVSAPTEEGLIYLFIARKGETRETDFRKGKWGDSMATCKSKEGKRDEYGLEDIYSFDTYVAGLKAIAGYRFTDDRLTSGKYVFTNENADNCIRDYDSIVSLLTKKYGEPAKVNKDYSANDFEKEHFSDGELARAGKLEMSTTWLTPFSIIVITLTGERYSVSMVLEYYSMKLSQMRENGILNDL